MKKGSDFLVRKYVYHSIDGTYLRASINYFDYPAFSRLCDDFPDIDSIASSFPSFKLIMKKPNYELTSWKDKHNNVIVRIIDKSVIQTKLNF